MATSVGVMVVFEAPTTPEEVVPAYEALIAQGVDAIVLGGGALNVARQPQVIEAARAARMPTVYNQQGVVPAGGLISAGEDTVATFAHAADVVDRLLKGATPADIPVVTPAALSTQVNLATAMEI